VWLKGDVLAGVAVAAYLVPQVMTYAEIAGVPAASGLAAACGSLVVYALLGSSRLWGSRIRPWALTCSVRQLARSR
jgi:SulP family sulfate permease